MLQDFSVSVIDAHPPSTLKYHSFIPQSSSYSLLWLQYVDIVTLEHFKYSYELHF